MARKEQIDKKWWVNTDYDEMVREMESKGVSIIYYRDKYQPHKDSVAVYERQAFMKGLGVDIEITDPSETYIEICTALPIHECYKRTGIAKWVEWADSKKGDPILRVYEGNSKKPAYYYCMTKARVIKNEMHVTKWIPYNQDGVPYAPEKVETFPNNGDAFLFLMNKEKEIFVA